MSMCGQLGVAPGIGSTSSSASAFVRVKGEEVAELEQQAGEEVHVLDNNYFDADLYGFAACALIRDTHLLAKDPRKRSARADVRLTRLGFSIGMLVINILLQIYLMAMSKKFITAAAVHDVRIAYSMYEKAMYDNDSLSVTRNGKYRGHGFENFHAAHFESLSESEKEQVCQTPLSEPSFCAVILLIWTLTCFGELRKIADLLLNVIVGLPAVSTMEFAVERSENAANDRVVVGLTMPVRMAMLFLLLIPRLVITLVLAWLGSRWLVATQNFGNLVLNAVALSFILGLKDLLYQTVIPERNKRDVATTQISPPYGSESASFRVYFAAALWLPLAVLWVALYMYKFQMVLPGYGWDISAVCQDWIRERYAV